MWIGQASRTTAVASMPLSAAILCQNHPDRAPVDADTVVMGVPEAIQRTVLGCGNRDTLPDRALRSAVHAHGLRAPPVYPCSWGPDSHSPTYLAAFSWKRVAGRTYSWS